MTGLLDSNLSLTRVEADAKALPCILIVAAEPAASDVARHLRLRLRAEVDILPGWSGCGDLLRQRNVTLVLLEEGLASTDPEAVNALYDSVADGWLLEANFGVADSERIARQVCSALRRKAQNEAHTRAAVLRSIRNQLTSCLTGLLLEAQLALRQTGPEAAPALARILDLAERLSDLVQTPGV